ncbi:MAG: AEC family transporter, partial [Hominilimicola sp.]
MKINFPEIIDKTLASLAKMASPLALITIGAGFEGRKAIAKIKPTIAATMIKLVVLPAVFLPIAIKLGFRDQALVALIIMLGSPTTPS